MEDKKQGCQIIGILANTNQFYRIGVKNIENNDFINEKLYEAMITATRIYFGQLIEETQKRRLENEDTENISDTEKECALCKTQ